MLLIQLYVHLLCLFGPIIVLLRKGEWDLKKTEEHLCGVELLLPVSDIFSDFQIKCYNILLSQNIKFKKESECCWDMHICQEEPRVSRHISIEIGNLYVWLLSFWFNIHFQVIYLLKGMIKLKNVHIIWSELGLTRVVASHQVQEFKLDGWTQVFQKTTAPE